MALQQNLCTVDAWLTEANAKLPVINGNTLTGKRKKFERRESVLIFPSIDLFVLEFSEEDQIFTDKKHLSSTLEEEKCA
jgi:hypothetical protein